MFAPFALGFAVLLATLTRTTLPRMGKGYMQIYHMRHPLPTVTSVTSVTKSLKASPEGALQMLQWRKKTATTCNNCNIATMPAVPIPAHHSSKHFIKSVILHWKFTAILLVFDPVSLSVLALQPPSEADSQNLQLPPSCQFVSLREKMVDATTLSPFRVLYTDTNSGGRSL